MNSLAYTLTITSQWRNTEKAKSIETGMERIENGMDQMEKWKERKKKNGQWRGIKREQQSSSNNQIKTKVSRHQGQSSRRGEEDWRRRQKWKWKPRTGQSTKENRRTFAEQEEDSEMKWTNCPGHTILPKWSFSLQNYDYKGPINKQGAGSSLTFQTHTHFSTRYPRSPSTNKKYKIRVKRIGVLSHEIVICSSNKLCF